MVIHGELGKLDYIKYDSKCIFSISDIKMEQKLTEI